ncbi:MAG: cyclic nucleotide-binding domain-containing protein [Opitutales bacterium]
MQQQAIINALSECQLFDSLDAGQLRSLSNKVQVLNLPSGETLFKEGDLGETLYFIIRGECNVIKEDDMGHEIHLASVQEGRILGEMAIVDNSPRSATVRARRECVLIALDRETFDAMSQTRADIAVEILRNIARLLSLNLRNTSGRLTAATAAASTAPVEH